MTNYLIIRGTAKGGKTTTAGLLFEKLKQKAEKVKIFNCAWKEIDGLKHTPKGSLIDFIAVLIIKGKVYIIISQGDVADDLKGVLEYIIDILNINNKTKFGITKIDVIICCARSIDREGSTYRMLKKRIESHKRFEFWTSKSVNSADKYAIKEKVTNDMIEKLNQF